MSSLDPILKDESTVKDPAQYFRAALVSASAITALVSSRVYAFVLPADVTLPAIRYYQMGGGETGVPSGGASGLVPEQETSFTVEGWAEDLIEARGVLSAVQDYLCDPETKTVSGVAVRAWQEGALSTDIDEKTGWFIVRGSFRWVQPT